MDSEAKLTAFLAGGKAPVRDPLFRVEVLARRERRLFQARMAVLMVVGAILTIAGVIVAGASAQWMERNPLIVIGAATGFGVAIVAATALAGRRLIGRL